MGKRFLVEKNNLFYAVSSFGLLSVIQPRDFTNIPMQIVRSFITGFLLVLSFTQPIFAPPYRNEKIRSC